MIVNMSALCEFCCFQDMFLKYIVSYCLLSFSFVSDSFFSVHRHAVEVPSGSFVVNVLIYVSSFVANYK